MTMTPKGGSAPHAAQNSDKTMKVRRLNDAFRRRKAQDNVYLTLSVAMIGDALLTELMTKVRNFSQFTPDSDPDGEHSFGSVGIGTKIVYWTIDYYDLDEEDESPDPSDPAVTTRVMTLMLASEY